jgi:hypothetical protein
MGQKTIKKLRKLARTLPKLEVERVIDTVTKMGSELLEEQNGPLVDRNGKKIQNGAKYRKNIIGKVEINHGRNMVKNYKKYGFAGVSGYITAVNSHNSHVTKQNIEAGNGGPVVVEEVGTTTGKETTPDLSAPVSE